MTYCNFAFLLQAVGFNGSVIYLKLRDVSQEFSF